MPGVVEKEAVAPAIPQIWQAVLDESAVAVNWSPSGEWLAAVSATGKVYLFDAASGTCVRDWSAHRFGATRLAWHPQEKRFVTAGQDGFVRLWDVGSQTVPTQPSNELDCGAEWVEHISWSPNGRLLATGAGRKLKLWTRDGELIREYPDHPNTIASIAWRPGSEDLVSACYGQLQFWTADTSEQRRAFYWKGSMLSLAWSPDSRYLCHGNQDSTVHFWIVSTGKDLQMWGYPMKVRALAWDHLTRYLATAGGWSITVWDCSGKGPANTKPADLKFHRAPVNHLAFQHAGRVLASGCEAGQLALWKTGKRKQPDAVAAIPAAISALSWSPDDSQVAVAAEDGTVAVFCPEKPAL
jgi:WD40 repeat protein